MRKLKMQSRDVTESNIKKIAALFPHCVTETANQTFDTNGKVRYESRLTIDFDKLRDELSEDILKHSEERYQFTWPDKQAASHLANESTTMTLRPCQEESVGKNGTAGEFDSENLYIEGDNLDVLKLLRETYLGKIDVIYIDPPYNTGKNLIYKNDFHILEEEYVKSSQQYDEIGNRLVSNLETNGRFHTDWLNMLYPRLKVARDFLSESGIIVVTIDDCEIETLTMMMNEIYGKSNHLATIIIKNNPSGRSTLTGASISHEYALFYSKNNNSTLGRLPRNDKQISRYKEKDEKGLFEWVNFRKHGGYREDAPSMYYPILIKKDGSGFRIPEMKWNEKEKSYLITDIIGEDEFILYPIDEAGRDRRWKWGLERTLKQFDEMTVRKNKDGQFAIYIKSRMNSEGMLPLTVWEDKLYSSTEYGTNFLVELLGERYFDYPKSIYAVIDCLKVANCRPDSIVLDFFSGSATTAHAVMQLNKGDGGNRKFIMVQIPEITSENSEAHKAGYNNICEIGKERIRCAGKKVREKAEQDAGNLDTGFRVLKLDSSNMEDVYYTPDKFDPSLLDSFVDNIKSDRTSKDLLFQVMLDLGIALSKKIERKEIASKEVFSVDDGYLLACFDADVNETTIEEMAKLLPTHIVIRDASASNDNVLDNFDQIIESYSAEKKITTHIL